MSPGGMKARASGYIPTSFFKAGWKSHFLGWMNLDLLPFQYPSFRSGLMGSRKHMTIKANPDWPQRRQFAESEQPLMEEAGPSPAGEDLLKWVGWFFF